MLVASISGDFKTAKSAIVKHSYKKYLPFLLTFFFEEMYFSKTSLNLLKPL